MNSDKASYIIEEVRAACVKNSWYTCGDNAAYDSMFQMIEAGKEPELIAVDIYEHSETGHDRNNLNPIKDAIASIYKSAKKLWPSPATKDDERKALAKIRRIVDSLGENSYIGTAFEGCFEIAEINIENDFADSMKGRAEAAQIQADNRASEAARAEERLEEAAADVVRLEAVANALKEKLKRAGEQLEAAQAVTMQKGLYISLYNLVDDDREGAERDMAQAAETMAHYADHPQDIAFQAAVNNYRKQARRRAECEHIIAELEKIEPKGV